MIDLILHEDALKHYNKAVTLMELNRYKQAIKELGIVLTKVPDSSNALGAMAECLFNEKRKSEALDFSAKAIKVNPTIAVNFLIRGRILADDSETANKGLKFIEKAIELEPSNSLFFCEAGRICLEMKKYEKAKLYIDKALILNPNDPDALTYKSNYEYSQGDKEIADILILKALNENPESVNAHIEKGNQAFKEADYQTAIIHFEQLMKTNPESYRVRDYLLTAKLGRNPLFHWLAIKNRVYYSYNYGVIFFETLLIFIGGVMLSEERLFSKYYPLKKIFFLLTFHSLVFWILRAVGHFYMSGKLWKLNLKDRLGYHFGIHLNTILALFAFIVFIFGGDYFWVSTGILMTIYSIYSMILHVIDKPWKRIAFKGYLMTLYVLGFINFVSFIIGYGSIEMFSIILVLGIFPPFFFMALIGYYQK